METLLKTATSRCPFLKNTPASQLRHLSTIKSNGSSALLRQAYRCPVLSKALHTTDPHQTSATSTLNATTTTTPSASLFEFHERPVFDYDAFFAGELEKKHSDQSYRYFNNINRLAKEYPLAHTRDPKEKVTVWCSNDYLGMSKHEGVIDAMKYFFLFFYIYKLFLFQTNLIKIRSRSRRYPKHCRKRPTPLIS